MADRDGGNGTVSKCRNGLGTKVQRNRQFLSIVPTVTMLRIVKAHLMGVKKGNALLKKKNNAFTFSLVLKNVQNTISKSYPNKKMVRCKAPKV
ncbi:hypothetical protein LguiA_016018 [Lonicera macranthoides]